MAPFWEDVDPHDGSSLRTPRELAEALVEEGFNLSYCRCGGRMDSRSYSGAH